MHNQVIWCDTQSRTVWEENVVSERSYGTIGGGQFKSCDPFSTLKHGSSLVAAHPPLPPGHYWFPRERQACVECACACVVDGAMVALKGWHTKGHSLAVIHHPETLVQAGDHADRGATEHATLAGLWLRPVQCQHCQGVVLDSPHHPRIRK